MADDESGTPPGGSPGEAAEPPGQTVDVGRRNFMKAAAPAAGAVVDGRTAAQATAAGLDLRAHLRGFDAYPALQRLGATLEPGATGVNVRDLRVLLRRPG